MKKTILILYTLILSSAVFAQSNTEIYLVDISKLNDKIELNNLRNISNNKGYDNQPSFYDDETIVFASTRNKQTDISMYKIADKKASWICNTGFGSEYSPLKVSNSKSISAVRLDTSGLQRLYIYNVKNGKSKELIKDLKVGYHVWHNKDILVTTVLVEKGMDLALVNLKTNSTQKLHKNVGRSLHKIPNSGLISFISNQTLMSVNPVSGEVKSIMQLPLQVKDMCWLTETVILIPDGKVIAQFNISDGKLSILHNFKEDEINDISRIAVSSDGKYLAFVSEDSKLPKP